MMQIDTQLMMGGMLNGKMNVLVNIFGQPKDWWRRARRLSLEPADSFGHIMVEISRKKLQEKMGFCPPSNSSLSLRQQEG
jgi:hypothetical protein